MRVSDLYARGDQREKDRRRRHSRLSLKGETGGPENDTEMSLGSRGARALSLHIVNAAEAQTGAPSLEA